MTVEDRLAQGETVSGPEVQELFGLVEQGRQHIFVYRIVLAFLKRGNIDAAMQVLEDAMKVDEPQPPARKPVITTATVAAPVERKAQSNPDWGWEHWAVLAVLGVFIILMVLRCTGVIV